MLILFIFAQNFLLMQPIGNSLKANNFLLLENYCTKQVVVNFDEPLNCSGIYTKEKFVKELQKIFKEFEIIKYTWSTKHIENIYAVQSIDLVLKNKVMNNNRKILFKIIFFMKKAKKDKWLLYYLNGKNI